MLGSAPSFPVLDEWQRMSESEQDALIGRMETARRRIVRNRWVIFALAFVGVAVGAGIGVYALLGGGAP
jgi:hypothetical protein